MVLTCSSDANPTVNSYTWYKKNGNETTEVGSGRNYTFTLNSYSYGDYLCEAKNKIGSTTSSAVYVSGICGFGCVDIFFQ